MRKSYKYNPMTVTNIGAPELQPLGNVVSSSPGSFGQLMKSYRSAQDSKHKFTTRTPQYPNFIPGYTGVTGSVLKGEWQTMTNVTAVDKKKLESLIEKYGTETLFEELYK